MAGIMEEQRVSCLGTFHEPLHQINDLHARAVAVQQHAHVLLILLKPKRGLDEGLHVVHVVHTAFQLILSSGIVAT